MANLKFSQFTEQTDTSNVQFIVGYNGATNVRISPANISGAYLPLAGGTLTGNVLFTDNTQLQLGTGNDMQIYHDPSGSGTNIFNSTLGSLKFIQNQNDGLIEFENDNGSGGIESYFILNGSDETIRAYKTLKSGTTNLALEANNAGFVEIRSANGTTPGTLQLNCEQNSHGIKIQGPPHSAGANYTLVFPTTDGGTGEFLQTNGSGVLTWAAAGTGTVTSVTTGNANTITIGGTSAAPTVAANTAAVTNGSLNLATGDQIYDFVIAQGYTTNIGTVTSVGLAMPAAFSVANSPVTTSGTLTVTGAGTTSQYVRGDGTLNTFPTIPTVPANIVETVTTTDGTFINLTPNTATDGAVTVTADLSATGTPSSSTYLRGDNTWAAISGGFTSFDITGGSGSAQTITNGNTVTLAQGTGISTVAGATDTVTITNTLPFNSLTLAGDSGASQSITNNNTITLAGGTGLSSVASATDTVTFNANVDGVQSIAAVTSTTTADRTYKVQVDSSDNLVVNVPWIAGSSGIGGSIASQQIAFGTGTNTIGGESDLIYNSSNNTLSVGSGTGSGSIYTTGNVTAEASLILGAYVYHNGDTNTRFGFPANDTFIIDTNGSERMRVASTGAVQLNTYGSGTFTGTAAYGLSVDSNGNIIETSSGGGIGGSISNTQVAFGNSSGEITGDVDFNFDVSTNTLRIGVNNDYSGGIFAMAMSADDVNGLAMKLGSSAATQPASYITQNRNPFNGQTKFGFGGPDIIAFNTSGSERLRINSSGSVGIGTTSPAAGFALDVNGRFKVQNNGSNVFSATPATGSFLLGDTNDVSGGAYINGDGTDIRIIVGGASVVTFKNNENVGIGTNTPASKLEVDGGDIEIDDSASGLILRSPNGCLLYTSPSPRDRQKSRMPSSA